MGMMSRDTHATIIREINLGQHVLFLMSDQSIDVMCSEAAPYVADNMFSLDSVEAYHLMISLQEMFKEASA
jgi:hypothetical protein